MIAVESAMFFLHLGDGELDVLIAMSKNLYRIIVHGLELDREWLVLSRSSCHLHVLHIHIMFYNERRIGI